MTQTSNPSPATTEETANLENCFIVHNGAILALDNPLLPWAEINNQTRVTLLIPLARLSKPGAYMNDREYLAGLSVMELKRADSNGMVTVMLVPRNPITTGLTIRGAVMKFLRPTTPPLILTEPILSLHVTVSDNRILEMTSNIFMPVAALKNPTRLVAWIDDTLAFARKSAEVNGIHDGVYEAKHINDITKYYTFRSSKHVPISTLRDSPTDIIESTDYYCGIKFEANNSRVVTMAQRLHGLLTNPPPTE